MKQIEELDLDAAKTVLSGLKHYADLRKKLGSRWRDLFHRSSLGKKLYVVEFADGISEDLAWAHAEWVYKKSFSEAVVRSDVVFTPRSSLKWGMKVYADDFMVDVSFTKVEKQMQK